VKKAEQKIDLFVLHQKQASNKRKQTTILPAAMAMMVLVMILACRSVIMWSGRPISWTGSVARAWLIIANITRAKSKTQE
jgi:hypothetical protein